MPDLPPEVREIFDRFCAQPLQTRASLEAAVEAHRQAAWRARERDGLVDLGMADQLAAACATLLGLWDDLDESQRREVQGAALYYVHQDDDEADFSSVMGFDDDADVVDFVARRLGRPDVALH